jgi:hypothetical protein
MDGNVETYDHDIKCNHDKALDPVRLRVCCNVVDQEARAEHNCKLIIV